MKLFYDKFCRPTVSGFKHALKVTETAKKIAAYIEYEKWVPARWIDSQQGLSL